MPKSYQLTAWDCLQLLTKRFSDQQVRMVVEFEGQLDASRLADAIRAAVAAEPVLACRVQERFFRPRWKPLAGLDATSVLTVLSGADTQAEIQRLIFEDLDPLRGPVVRFALVRGERDVLVINLDHTAGDAALVRSLAYLLASAYVHPEKFAPPECGPYFSNRGFRALRPLMSASGPKKSPGMPPASAQPSWRFPWGGQAAEFRKRLLIRRLAPERAAVVRDFTASRHAWLNDVFLAAYFRALSRLVGDGAGVPRLTVPVDLRSYIPARERPRIANFSASFEAAPGEALGATLDETLTLVRATTEKEKGGRPGLGQAAALTSLADRVPYRIIRNRFEKGKVRMTMPPPWFIALGVLRPESLAFGAVAARHAYSLQSFGRAGSVFQLSASTFADAMTFAVCFTGDDAQESMVKRFLDLYEAELPA